ncbi:MAG: hypothetical protein ACW98Y_09375 [Candidatus Thorarchaeota archaeon]|jgi:uncharacterized protein (UPF0333 family)
MVSRSLEKMLLIAIGLTTVVMVGVPVLLYSMDVLSSASQLEMAQSFASNVHNATGRVDLGQANNTLFQIVVPQYVTISASGSTLTITYAKEGSDTFSWSNSYMHPINLAAPASAGSFIMSVSLIGGEVQLAFSSTTL